MTTSTRGLVAVTALSVLAAGCGSSATPRSRGEAETVVVSFYEALVRCDWPAAHALLHSENRASCPLDSFTSLAAAYWRRLGFEPQEVRVRSCEEHEEEAVAHVLLVGRQGGHEKTHRDAIILRRDGSGWGIVLPARFGRQH
jgi:hypothetical protein